MQNLFGEEEEKNNWYEIEQVCTVCNKKFKADYAYHMLCPQCRLELSTKTKDDEK